MQSAREDKGLFVEIALEEDGMLSSSELTLAHDETHVTS